VDPDAPTPTVSVVIPTRGRPALLARALRSVLAQTRGDLEVVVVADGPDPTVAAVVAAANDRRVRLVTLPIRGGASAARNAGIAASRGAWIALLDDDDEWLPAKLERQLGLAAEARDERPVIVACRLRVMTPRATYALPRRLPRPDEPMSDYLTLRSGLFHGEGFLQTSTILAPRELFRLVPFDARLRRLQELTWGLRAARDGGATLLVDGETLAIWHWDEDRARVSDAQPWAEGLAWAHANRDAFTRRAYAAFLLTTVSSMAAQARAWRGGAALLREAFRHGSPSALDVAACLQIWILPRPVRFAIRERVMGRRRTVPAAPVVRSRS
jgi:glycosyltransferase involved in cell wall biosynthesis